MGTIHRAGPNPLCPLTNYFPNQQNLIVTTHIEQILPDADDFFNDEIFGVFWPQMLAYTAAIIGILVVFFIINIFRK